MASAATVAAVALLLAWCGAGIDAENPPEELIATGNEVLRCPAGRPAVLLRRKPARMSFAENRYQSEPDARPDRLFQVAGKDLALADFALMTVESGGLFVGVPPMLPDALAGESVLASIVRQRGRGPGEWPENDTAQAFVSRIPRVM